MRRTLNPFPNFRDRHAVCVFDTPSELMAHLTEALGRGYGHGQADSVSGSFYSNETWRDVSERVVTGSPDFAEKSRRLMDKVQAASIQLPEEERVASHRGRAVVGALLAGDPLPCRSFREVESDTAPISLVVSLNSIGSVSASKLEARGVAIAALVRKLATKRPVSLYLSRFSETHARGYPECMLVKFPTTPIDSYRLAYLLSSQGFCRGAGFTFHLTTEYRDANNPSSHGISFAGGVGYSQKRRCPFSRDLSSFLGSDVFYVPGSDPSNNEFQRMASDPLAWVNETFAELTKA